MNGKSRKLDRESYSLVLKVFVNYAFKLGYADVKDGLTQPSEMLNKNNGY